MKSNLYLYRLYLCLLLVAATGTIKAQNLPQLSETQPSGVNTNSYYSISPLVATPANGYNYRRVYSPGIPIADSANVNDLSPASEVRKSTFVTDGFNRPLMDMHHASIKNGTALYMNQVKPYNNVAKQYSAGYLPYATFSASLKPDFVTQTAFNNSIYPGEQGNTYSVVENKSDAASRKVVSYAPGVSHVGQARGIIRQKTGNAASEVKMYIVQGGMPVQNGYYPEKSLRGELVSNENSAQTLTYTDKEGRTVMTRTWQKSTVSGYNVTPVYVYTYYVYDVLGNLCFIIPPKAAAVAGNLNQSQLDELCFRYRYDAEGRTIEKQDPGKGKEEYVYDRWGRQVLYRDANRNSAGKWSFTVYDAANRPLVTGNLSSTQSRAVLAAIMENNTTYTAPDLMYYLKNYELYQQYPASITSCEITGYHYYDTYASAGMDDNTVNTLISNLAFSELATVPDAEIPQLSKRTQGMPVGSKIRINPAPGAIASETGEWRYSYIFYDEKGRVVYAYSKDEYQGNVLRSHVTGSQYGFANNVLTVKHVLRNSLSINDPQTTHTEVTRSEYDPTTGTLIGTKHKVNNGIWNTLSLYTYDLSGRVKRKVLGNYGEVQDMKYNIRGQLTAINGDYTLSGDKEGFSRSFGEVLRYDYGFDHKRYDGKVSGMLWRGSNTSKLYAYGYGYTNDGMLTAADFRHKLGAGSWSNAQMDYTVSNIAYDQGGNLQSRNQKGMGVVGGSLSIVDIDQLTYNYSAGSNKLEKVEDVVSTDYGTNDFQNGNAGSTDYSYDANGNLTMDLNKGISNISYTLLNKPEVITFSNGKTIRYSYTAAGDKVQELISEHVDGRKQRIYSGNALYVNNELQYIGTGEGRTVYNADSNTFKEEFFVKDHLGNVRSTVEVVTYATDLYLASYEIASANLEGLFFDHHNEVRDTKPLSTDPNDNEAGRLNGADPDRRIGTSLMVHVMAGDQVELDVNNYYTGYDKSNDNPVDAGVILENLLSTLSNGTGGFQGSESHNIELMGNILNSATVDDYNSLLDAATAADQPKAYLNYLMFDESMQLVPEMSGAFQANGSGTWTPIGTAAPMLVPVNGYFVVFLSNSTNDAYCNSCGDVFFDQLTVKISNGSLREETHYYPHGLPITTLGSKGRLFMEQRHRYQGNEYIKEEGLHWMDFHNRQYDPQIGRFLSIDPLAAATLRLSPYAAMNNNPVSMVDPWGLAAVNMEVPLNYSVMAPADGADPVRKYNGPGAERDMEFEQFQESYAQTLAAMRESMAQEQFEEVLGMFESNSSETVVTNGDEPNDEQPVNAFSSSREGDKVFHTYLDNLKKEGYFKDGDNNFYWYGHGTRGGLNSDATIEDASGNSIVSFSTADEFDNAMSKKSDAYSKVLKSGESFTLQIWTCHSADVARNVSTKHPKAVVMGVKGLVIYQHRGGENPKKVSLDLHKNFGKGEGYLIFYIGGVEKSRFYLK